MTPSSFAGAFARRAGTAFSLVEVVLAIGIVSFAVVAMLGLMATGLRSAEGSAVDLALANITRSLRAEAQATPYADLSRGEQTFYFTEGGYPTPDNSTEGAFYRVVMTPAVPAGSITTNNALVMGVQVYHPYPAQAQSNAFALFVAP